MGPVASTKVSEGAPGHVIDPILIFHALYLFIPLPKLSVTFLQVSGSKSSLQVRSNCLKASEGRIVGVEEMGMYACCTVDVGICFTLPPFAFLPFEFSPTAMPPVRSCQVLLLVEVLVEEQSGPAQMLVK